MTGAVGKVDCGQTRTAGSAMAHPAPPTPCVWGATRPATSPQTPTPPPCRHARHMPRAHAFRTHACHLTITDRCETASLVLPTSPHACHEVACFRRSLALSTQKGARGVRIGNGRALFLAGCRNASPRARLRPSPSPKRAQIQCQATRWWLLRI